MKKISERELEKRFERIMKTNPIQGIEKVAILQLNAEEYHLFGRYFLTKKNSNNIVVSLHNGDIVNSFYSMKNAVCWCVFDQRGMYSDANRIILLDNKISGLEVNIAIHKRLFIKTADIDTRLIYLAKLNEERIQKKEMFDELSGYITDSYNWQQKQFDLKTKQ